MCPKHGPEVLPGGAGGATGLEEAARKLGTALELAMELYCHPPIDPSGRADAF